MIGEVRMKSENGETNLERFLCGRLPLVFLLVVVFLVYSRILGHDFLTMWDDNYYVTENPHSWGISLQNIRGAFTTFYTGNYAPVQIISYMFDFTVWGLNPAGFLFTNIVIHSLNGLLFFRLLLRWYQDRVLALFAVALFLLHPVQVETVAWVSQRKNLLAVMFMLIAWEFYCRYRESMAGQGRIWYTVSLFTYTLSLLAKSVTVTFPLILLVYDLSFAGEGKRLRFKDKIPFLLIALLVAVITFLAQNPDVGNGGRTAYHGGSPWATLLSMLPIFCRYLGMLVWPGNLSAHYGLPVHGSIDIVVIGSTLLLAIVGLLGRVLWRSDRRKGFWFLFFWIALLPVSQIVPLVTIMNDRYLYLPILGFVVLAGSSYSQLLNIGSRRLALPIHVVSMALLVVLAIVSFNRTSVWSDSITLFRDVVSKYPESDIGWRSLADATQQTGRIVEARRIYEQALTYNPNNQTVLVGLGKLLTSMNKLDEADVHLRTLLSINPEHAAGWVAMGENLAKKGEYGEAEKACLRALAIQPNAVQIFLLLSNISLHQGRYDKARYYLEKMETKNPNNPEVAYRRACLEAQAGEENDALDWLEKAIQRGYHNVDAIYDNKELSTIWNNPRFPMLLEKYFPGKVPN